MPHPRSHRPLCLLIGTLISASLMITGCNPPRDPGSTEPLPENEGELIQAAQKEGQVNLGAGGHTTAQADLLEEMFEEKYDIDVEYVRENSGQIGQKIEAQHDAGNMSFDAVSLNDSSTLNTWSDEGLLADAALKNSAEIVEPLRTDNDRYVAFTWAAAGFVYNESTVEPSEVPSTWKQLAESGATVVLADPGGSGAALNFVGAIEETAPDLLPALGAKKVLTSESALALGQMVTTGEATFGLPGIEHDVSTAKAAGEPLAMGYPEGRLGVLRSFISPLDSAAHPAAARLLVQFSLSPEFQIAQRDLGSRSVLNSVGVPKNMEEVTPDRMLVQNQDELAARKDELIADFTEAVH